jgi:hypothetical protein
VSVRTLLVALMFLAAAPAFADRVPKLRINDLPSIREEMPPPPSAVRVLPPVEDRFERAVWVLTMRAQQIADPRGRVPAFLPILGTQVIGGSLRLDF